MKKILLILLIFCMGISVFSQTRVRPRELSTESTITGAEVFLLDRSDYGSSTFKKMSIEAITTYVLSNSDYSGVTLEFVRQNGNTLDGPVIFNDNITIPTGAADGMFWRSNGSGLGSWAYPFYIQDGDGFSITSGGTSYQKKGEFTPWTIPTQSNPQANLISFPVDYNSSAKLLTFQQVFTLLNTEQAFMELFPETSILMWQTGGWSGTTLPSIGVKLFDGGSIPITLVPGDESDFEYGEANSTNCTMAFVSISDNTLFLEPTITTSNQDPISVIITHTPSGVSKTWYVQWSNTGPGGGEPGIRTENLEDLAVETIKIDNDAITEMKIWGLEAGISGDIVMSNGGGAFMYGSESDPVYTAWDKDYDDLTNTPTIPSGDQIIDWTISQAISHIHEDNYTDNIGTDDQTAEEVYLDGYVIPEATGAIGTDDAVQVAIGKLEKGLEDATQGGGDVNVQSDWDQSDTGSDDFIKNKPTIPSGNAILDWTTDQGATDIHAGNYTDTDTQLSDGDVGAFGYIKNADETDQVWVSDSVTYAAKSWVKERIKDSLEGRVWGNPVLVDVTGTDTTNWGVQSSGLYQITEDGKTGWVPIGDDRTMKGNTGEKAWDLSYSDFSGDTWGAKGLHSFATGYLTSATGIASFAEGSTTVASGASSHAEGSWGEAIGASSHAEGYWGFAIGHYSHVEGQQNYAYGITSHAEGYFTIARNDNSHSGGKNTIANNDNQRTIGQFNDTTNTLSIFDIGIGTANDARLDALEIETNGKIYAWGLDVGEITDDKQLITKEYAEANFGGLSDAPSNGSLYGRQDAAWALIPAGTNWENDLSPAVIHANNYVDNNTQLSDGDVGAFGYIKNADETDQVFVAWDKDYDDLTNTPTIPSGNQIIDWTTDQGGTDIHAGNYTDNNTTYSEAQLDQDDVTLLDIQTATISDFHNIGGTDDILTDGEIGAMGYIKSYTDDQDLIMTGDVLSIEGGQGSVDLATYVDDADADASNELQNIDGSVLTGTVLTIGIANGTNEDVELSSLVGSDDQTGSEVSLVVTEFNGNLSSADTDVQKALETLDNMAGGGSVPEAPIDGSTYGRKDADWEAIVIPLAEIFEKTLTDAENDIPIGFTLKTTSLVFFNGDLIRSSSWSGVGTSTINLSLDTKIYDKITIKN